MASCTANLWGNMSGLEIVRILHNSDDSRLDYILDGEWNEMVCHGMRSSETLNDAVQFVLEDGRTAAGQPVHKGKM